MGQQTRARSGELGGLALSAMCWTGEDARHSTILATVRVEFRVQQSARREIAGDLLLRMTQQSNHRGQRYLLGLKRKIVSWWQMAQISAAAQAE